MPTDLSIVGALLIGLAGFALGLIVAGAYEQAYLDLICEALVNDWKIDRRWDALMRKAKQKKLLNDENEENADNHNE